MRLIFIKVPGFLLITYYVRLLEAQWFASKRKNSSISFHWKPVFHILGIRGMHSHLICIYKKREENSYYIKLKSSYSIKLYCCNVITHSRSSYVSFTPQPL